jgi:hypothetical protein
MDQNRRALMKYMTVAGVGIFTGGLLVTTQKRSLKERKRAYFAQRKKERYLHGYYGFAEVITSTPTFPSIASMVS